MEVRELCSRGVFRNISFSVKEGEILGFAGLVGAGRSEVMRAVFGLDEYQSGEIFVNGKKAEIHRTEDAIAAGIAMVSEDRRAEGIIPIRSARENITLPFIKKFRKHGLISKKRKAERRKK